MKKIIILTVICGAILTFIIYKITYHETLNLLVLGDGLATGITDYDVEGYSFNDYMRDQLEDRNLEEYITEFANQEETSESLERKITSNFTLESTGLSIQQAISKAKMITIAIGTYELNQKSKLKSKEIENYLNRVEKIIKLIKAFNNKSIFLIGLYPTEKVKESKMIEINKRLNEISNTYQVTFIDIFDIKTQKKFFFQETSIYPNYKGHKWISEKIENKIDSISCQTVCNKS